MKKDAIFVSIASYRDSVCSSTVESLYSNANDPFSIYIGICQQNAVGDVDCVYNLNPKIQIHRPQMRVIRTAHSEAKGPTWARYLCSTLYDQEEFYLQIDSHMTFVKGWDRKCKDMIYALEQRGIAKPVLSYYPRGIEEQENYKATDKTMVPRMCRSFFNDRGMISFEGSEHVDTQNEFYETPFFAAGFFFARGSFLNEVPYDPYLDFIFVGEEILHAIRLWTWGYTIVTPNENIVFHEYTRAEKPKIWTDNTTYSDATAFAKIKQLIELEKNTLPQEYARRYGLGKVRSLDEFYTFAGINTKEKKVNKDFCHAHATIATTAPPLNQLRETFTGNFAPSSSKGSRSLHVCTCGKTKKWWKTWWKLCIILVFILIIVAIWTQEHHRSF